MNTAEESGESVTDSNSNTDEYTDVSTDEDSNMSSHSSHSDDDLDLASNAKQNTSKVTCSMQEILKEMVKKRLLLGENEMMLTYEAEDVDMDYDNNKAVELFAEPPTDSLKRFGSFLHHYSPRAYEYIRNHYHTPLPSIKVLGTWCENDKFKPGFTKQAFDILEKKSIEKGGRLIFSLVVDELQLFVCNRSVPLDVGGGALEGDFVDESEGREAYVMLLVSLEENWKIPVCYLISEQSFGTEVQVNLIEMCLHRSYEIGVDVVSITTTMRIAEALGCRLGNNKNLKTTFKHPVSGDKVAVFGDPTVSLRSLYHALCTHKEFLNGQKGKISMEYIKKLGKILANTSFQLNFSTDTLDLLNMLSKIELISELMLPSLGAFLELCKNRLKLPGFAGAGPTIEYITMINTLYYILHSKVGQSGYRKPISQENGMEILEFLEEAKKYISLISYEKRVIGKHTNRMLAVEDNFDGFKSMLVSIESLKHLYTTLVAKGVLNCIPTHLLSWDQMDDFLAVIRKYNPSLDGSKIHKVYKRFFKDLKSTLTGGTQIESYSIYSVTGPLDVIKKSSGKRAFDEMYSVVGEKRRKTEDDKRADTNITKFIKILNNGHNRMENYQMVGYIAGYVAVQLARNLRCEDCIDGLLTNEKQWFHKYITLRELKGVRLPSKELFMVCWECERALRLEMATPVSRRLISRAVRLPPVTHSTHHIPLTRAVMAKYLRLRLGLDNQKRPRRRAQQWFFDSGLCF